MRLRPIPTRGERLAALGFDPAQLEHEEVSACDLCGGGSFVQVVRHDRYGLAVTAQLCAACGLVFLSPRPTAAGYEVFYRDVYRPLVSAYSGTTIDPTTLPATQSSYAARLDEHALGREIRRRGLGNGWLLDVGASTGEVAAHFARRYGFRPVCVEPAPAEAAAARERGFETHVGTLDTFEPGDRRFQVILLCQTIDHLLSPAATLTKIHRLLADDGLFIVDPLDFLAVARAAPTLGQAFKIDHPFYLTRQTTELYLRRAGFTPLSLDVSGNVWHLDYVCGRGRPETVAPAPGFADALLEELRRLQVAPARLRTSLPPPTLVRRLVRRIFGR